MVKGLWTGMVLACLSGSAFGQEFYGQEVCEGPVSAGSGEPLFPYDDQDPWKHGYLQIMPYYGGLHSFRPYNYKQVLSQSRVAEGWGMSPTTPYSQQFWHRYEQQANLAHPRGFQGDPPPTPGFYIPDGHIPDGHMLPIDPSQPLPGGPSPLGPSPLGPRPLGPSPTSPHPVHPGPVHPGPVHPGPVHPGPVHPGEVHPGPMGLGIPMGMGADFPDPTNVAPANCEQSAPAIFVPGVNPDQQAIQSAALREYFENGPMLP